MQRLHGPPVQIILLPVASQSVPAASGNSGWARPLAPSPVSRTAPLHMAEATAHPLTGPAVCRLFLSVQVWQMQHLSPMRLPHESGNSLGSTEPIRPSQSQPNQQKMLFRTAR
jgi:hypothetical protein